MKHVCAEGLDRRFSGRRLGCDGGATAEFAMVIPLLLVLIVGIYEYGRIFFIQNTLQYAAEQGGRWLMVNTSATNAQIATAVCGYQNASSSCGQGSSFDVNVTPAAQTNATCFTSGTTSATVTTSTCMRITVQYQLSSAADPVLGLLFAIVGIAAHHSASAPNITVTGLSETPIS